MTKEIVGFFIIETHVLNTTGSFRSEREVEELWDALLTRLTSVVDNALKKEKDADSFLRVKESLMGFVMTLEASVSVPQSLDSSNHYILGVLLLNYEPTRVYYGTFRTVRDLTGKTVW